RRPWRKSCRRTRPRRSLMNCRQLIRMAGATVAVVTIGACNRSAAPPELQTTTGVQLKMEPVMAVGCLRHGLAEKTFVLTTADAATGKTSTYQLTDRENLHLLDYAGQQVEISGTVRAEEQVAS